MTAIAQTSLKQQHIVKLVKKVENNQRARQSHINKMSRKCFLLVFSVVTSASRGVGDLWCPWATLCTLVGLLACCSLTHSFSEKITFKDFEPNAGYKYYRQWK